MTQIEVMSCTQHTELAKAWIQYAENFWAFVELDDMLAKSHIQALSVINQIAQLSSTDEVLGMLAVGPLEDILCAYADELYEVIANFAKANAKFAHCLQMGIQISGPGSDRIKQLIEQLKHSPLSKKDNPNTEFWQTDENLSYMPQNKLARAWLMYAENRWASLELDRLINISRTAALSLVNIISQLSTSDAVLENLASDVLQYVLATQADDLYDAIEGYTKINPKFVRCLLMGIKITGANSDKTIQLMTKLTHTALEKGDHPLAI